MIQSPTTVVLKLFDFADVSGVDAALAYCAENIDTASLESWRNHLDEWKLRDIEPIARPVMEYLGYAWT